MDDVMTIPEVAQLYKTSRGSVYTLIAKGELETTDVGTGKRSRTRVYRKSAEALLANRRNR